jgi:hypothetical protein
LSTAQEIMQIEAALSWQENDLINKPEGTINGR